MSLFIKISDSTAVFFHCKEIIQEVIYKNHAVFLKMFYSLSTEIFDRAVDQFKAKADIF